MARPTKRDQAISEALGGLLSPSQLNRLTAEGFDLPPEGFQALAPLVGTGRDLDVAAVRLAAEHGFCTTRLRRVIARPGAPGQAGSFLTTFTDRAERAATQALTADEGRLDPGATIADEARVMTASALLECDDALDGTGEVCFEDMRTVASEIATECAVPPDVGMQRHYNELFAGWMAEAASRCGTLDEWVAKTPADQIVAFVKQSCSLCAMLFPMTGITVGEEAFWRMVALTAPHIGAVFEAISVPFS